jgi:hypothetical protein
VPGGLDAVLALPGVDRRCLSSNDSVAQDRAIIGVYSDTKRADLDAARGYCAAQRWTNS